MNNNITAVKEYIVEFFVYITTYGEGNYGETSSRKCVINTHTNDLNKAFDIAVKNGHNPMNTIKCTLV